MSDATPHLFDEAIALQPAGDGRWTGHTHTGWANMVGPFGGITAAQALNAVLSHPERLGDPVAATFNFAAALEDGPFVATARPARTNRSTQHWVFELSQKDQVVMTGTAVTGVRRDTWGLDDMPMPDGLPRPDALPRAPGAKPVAWLSRYDQRYIHGMPPRTWDGSDSGDSLTQLWLRDEPSRPLDFAALCAQCDVFFPRVWLRLATFMPVGTVSMTIYFHTDAATLAQIGTDFVFAQARAKAFRQGFFDQSGQMWSAQGRLLATTHQVVYYKG